LGPAASIDTRDDQFEKRRITLEELGFMMSRGLKIGAVSAELCEPLKQNTKDQLSCTMAVLLDSLGISDYIPRCSRRGRSVDKQLDLLQGTLDILILKAASLGPLHGYGILLRIQQISKDRLEIQQGSLYPALYRLEHQGWITSEWGESENNRKAKYYRLTAAGKRRLQTEADKWNRMADVIAGILHTTPEEI
jgi:PadR family transcriptional regulator, regulatory protein PadR